MSNSKKITTYDIVAVGFMAALVFVSSYISIPLPTIIGNTRIHLGNVFCLLAGLLLGGLKGGLASGIGSCFFDLTNPLYIASAPFTLVFKFMIGFLAGKIAYGGRRAASRLSWNILACAVGSFTYVLLYIGKAFAEDVWFLGTEVQTAWIDVSQKAAVSSVNALIACVIAVPLAFALKKALSKTRLYQMVMR